MLQEEKQRSTSGRSAGRTLSSNINICAVAAPHRIRPKPWTHRGRRCVSQESCDTVKQVSASEESAKHLGITTMYPLPARLRRVLAFDERNIVLDLSPPEEFINVRLQEEWVAEAERRTEAHCNIGQEIRLGCFTRTFLAGVSKVDFVDER